MSKNKLKNGKEILEFFVEYKWDKDSPCSKCNEKKGFGKSIYEFGRRCKACGYDESVTANTCFHGIQFSLAMAYDIIVYIKDNSLLDWNERVISLQKENAEDGDIITPNQLVELMNNGKARFSKFDSEISSWAKETRVTVRRLAEKFKLEENTIQLFIDKIFKRLPIFDTTTNNMTNIVDYFASEQHDMDHIFGLLMFPMPDDLAWEHCKATIGNNLYVARPPAYTRFGSRGVLWRRLEQQEAEK